MNSLSEALKTLSISTNPSDRKEQSHALAKLFELYGRVRDSRAISLRSLSNHISNHVLIVDTSSLPSSLGDAKDIKVTDDLLVESKDALLGKLFNQCVHGAAEPFLHSEKKVDLSKLFAEAVAPPLDTGTLVSMTSSHPSMQRVSPVIPTTNLTNTAPIGNSKIIAGVKRLGGFRPPVVLPIPTVQEAKAEDEEEEEEYEPDPKIRAKKQWRKQYDAAKKREAERKYNTPKYADDTEPKENAVKSNFSSSHPSAPNNRQPQPPPPRPAGPPTVGNRPGFRPASKFVSPLLKKNDADQQPQQGSSQEEKQQVHIDGAIKENFIKTALSAGAELQQQDERLKTLDPTMIDLILSEIVDHGPKTEWEDVAGLETVKKSIMEVIVWPMLRPDLFRGIRGPPKGLLLFGPPGTGKTMIGKCIASQCNATFFSISASSLLSKWFGEAEKMVKTLFAVARTRQPAVIFIDEVDSMLCKRGQDDQECSRRIKTEFLVQLDGVTCGDDERILMIGATNLPDELDEAARRRFGKRLYVALPSLSARIQMVRRVMGKMASGECELSDEDYQEIGRRSDGYSGSDISHLCREAAMGPMRSISDIASIGQNEIRAVNINDFLAAFNLVRPSIAPKDLVELEEWNRQYGTITPAATSVTEARKASSAQLEAERNLILSLIQSGSCRVSFAICAAGRAPVWTLFRKVLLDNNVTPFVVCQVCGKLLKYTSRDGTKSMKLHMSKCTPVTTGGENQNVNNQQSSLENTTPAATNSNISNSDSRGSNSAFSPWESVSVTPSVGLPPPLSPNNHFSAQEDSTLDLSLPHSPSAAVTSLTPALSHVSEPPPAMLNQAALQTVTKALQSALQIFDGDVNEVELEIASLENKLVSLNAKRDELIRRKETVRRAAIAVGSHSVQSNHQPAGEDDYDVVPCKRSRRKQSSSDVRHFSPIKLDPGEGNAANSS